MLLTLVFIYIFFDSFVYLNYCNNEFKDIFVYVNIKRTIKYMYVNVKYIVKEIVK